MSAKINVFYIIKAHYVTLYDVRNFKATVSDIITFLLVPLCLSGLVIFYGAKLNNEIISLSVNFGAIFTALLLSVLVLVYEQESKLRDKIATYAELHKDEELETDYSFIDPNVNVKLALMRQLYVNISYCIITSMLLVAFSAASLVLMSISAESVDISCYNDILFNPIIVFLLSHIIITILMVVKRIHTLLVTQ